MAPVVAIAGLAYGAYQQYRGGQAAEEAGAANARAAAEMAAARVEQQRMLDQRSIAASRAMAGASGVAVGQGSPLYALAEAQRQAERNAEIIRRGGELEAGQYRRQGRAAAQAGTAGAVGTVLTGASNYLQGL